MELEDNLLCSGYNCFENNFFDENFQKGIITHASYKGLSIEQNPHIISVFDELISNFKFERVLEIGSFHGGLTLIIRDLLDKNNLQNSDVLSYDVYLPEFVFDITKGKKIIFSVKNLFSDSYLDFFDRNTKEEIRRYVTQEGSTLVLCDGGSKKNEFRLISELIKKGDVIMAHDYSPNQKYFEDIMYNNFWNWMEINDLDIEDVCEKNYLVPLMQESFTKVGWVCKLKK